MNDFYLPYEYRVSDSQYRDRIKYILKHGTMVRDTPQGVGALTCFGTLPAMVFDMCNGAPVITDRSMQVFWRKAIAEIIAFANGVRTVSGLIDAGCNYWKDYYGKGVKLGLDPDDLGPGSYGPGFHDFPMPDGNAFGQYAAVIQQIKDRPEVRTHYISPWIPFYQFRGSNRKAVVSPCHGWQQYRVFDGKLHLLMWQRSADFPIGVPSNMVQYAAMLLMMAKATGYEPGTYVHQFGDAHIYETQIEHMKKLVRREPKILPTLTLANESTDFFSFRKDDFGLTDYNPHPAIPGIPYHP